MEIQTLTTMLLSTAVMVSFYRYILQPVFISPLRKIPAAHPLAAISEIWIWYMRWIGQENSAIQIAHDQKGPIVRLSPSELNVNFVDGGVRTIYHGKSGGYAKHTWYDRFAYFGLRNMFSSLDTEQHSQRKRMMSGLFSKSSLFASKELTANAIEVVYNGLYPVLRDAARGGYVVDIHELFKAATLDFVSAYLFGLSSSSRLLVDEVERKQLFRMYQAKKDSAFWYDRVPQATGLTSLLHSAFSPSHDISAAQGAENFCLNMCSSADQKRGGPEARPKPRTVYNQLRDLLSRVKENDKSRRNSRAEKKEQQRTAASEMFDHLTAGHQTSAATLSYLTYELSLHPAQLGKLQEELKTLAPKFTAPQDDASPRVLPNFSVLDSLPYLDAVVIETLRRHPPIAGPQPRVAPPAKNVDTLLGQIPANTRVSAQAYSLHRNADVFVEPLKWYPERWIKSRNLEEEAHIKEMYRWFWAFGSGGRMCIGSHLAMLQIKLIVAATFSNWVVLIEDGVNTEPADGYKAGLKADKMNVRLGFLKT